ncbi:TonB-dependent receptor domain-containing protein [Aquabacterium humicola]|uniref:TonB-dependent receptor domain-containing protein n=1 Tax=Aquabacterium humicola TaxID=3237377 RepID=UPI0025428D10|nr:TonB-dependent receptor [Rubrivivax pictus]
MMKKTKLSRALLLAFGGSALLMSYGEVIAQTQRVEVTGSLIRRIDGESSLQTVTLSSATLQQAGVTNAEQAVKFITQQQGGTVTSGSVSSTNGAAAYADLRSLGAQRTLVLLNGKRVVPNPFSSVAVDLNTLPMAAIDRVEVLPDGASSTYGTDAIAGVINFITKKNYKGGEIGLQAQMTEHGGADTQSGAVLGGIGDMAQQGWNVYGTLSFRKQDPMKGTEREFSKTSYIPSMGFNALSPTTHPANYSQSGTITNTNPTLPNCSPPTSLFTTEPAPIGLGNNRCGADTQAFTHTIPDQEQTSLYVKGSFALGSNHTFSAEYFKALNKVTTQIAPSPEGGLTMNPSSPYYPGKGINPITDPKLDSTRPISVSWRTVPLGPRRGQQENDTQRFVAGVEGSLGSWDYSASALWSNSFVENYFLNGYPMTQPLRNGVSGTNGAPHLNPFGDQSAAGLAYLQQNQVLGKVQDGEGTLQSISGNASTQFGSLGGGAVTLAVGAEARTEEMVYRTDVGKVSQAASSGLAGAGALREGDRDVKAVALELNLPFLKSLELNLSVRYDKYSDFGNTTNPKVSLRWSPTKELLVRASANTGFTAPTLTQLYAPNSTTFTATRYNDPVLCPGGVPTANAVPSRDCGIQFQQLQGGNTGLTAEESRAWSAGFVMQATPQVSFAMDYWSYYIKDSISVIGEQSIFADPAKYANLYVRCSQAPEARRNAIGACQIPGGDPLAYVINTNLNLGDVETKGVDVRVDWNSGATPMGRFNASVRGSYVDKYKFQVEPGGRWFDPNGKYNPQFAGPVIRYQQVTTIGWERDAWGVLVNNKFQRGYWDQNAVPAPFNTHRVGDYSVWDLSVSYKGIKGLTLNAAVLNLLDKDPPFSNQVGRFQARAYDDRFHDPRGRMYQLSAKYQF